MTVCIVCPQFHNGDPRPYEEPHVCDRCRKRLADMLTELPRFYTDLPDHLERGSGAGEKVSGGEVEARLPFREDVWDLLLPLRLAPVTASERTEQVGYVGVVTTLHFWVQDWAHHRDQGEHGSGQTIDLMSRWLSGRLDWACLDHPAVDEFAHQLRRLHSAVTRFSGNREPRPQPCIGVPCRRCDLMALARLADGSGDVECQNPTCRTIYRADEYQRWVKLLAAAVKETA